MRYLLLASDYDGTLARNGKVDQRTIEALERFIASGRRLLLITGRALPDLQRVFPHLHLFAYVVAENGALLYQPASDVKKLLCPPPSERLIQILHARGITPLGTGEVIVATSALHKTTVLEILRELRLELQVIANKADIMILPRGINKATGLVAALHELGISPQDVVGVGDAENDLAFLAVCGYAVAVNNALPLLKEQADYTTRAADGEGVTELIELLIADDLPKIG